jgi:hypothetical protein
MATKKRIDTRTTSEGFELPVYVQNGIVSIQTVGARRARGIEEQISNTDGSRSSRSTGERVPRSSSDLVMPFRSRSEPPTPKDGARPSTAGGGLSSILGRVLPLAYIAKDGRAVEVPDDVRDKLMATDPAIRRELVKWSAMARGRGRVILLDVPEDVPVIAPLGRF